MKRCRVELSVILEIDVENDDDELALELAEEVALGSLNDRVTGRNIFDNADDGIYMASAGVSGIECEEVDYK